MASAAKTTPIHARDARVDAYIAKAAPFARPILTHLRDVIHAACPEVEEVTKWSMPFFVHRGNLCMMGAFKAHCGFGFWRAKEMPGLPEPVGEDGMGQFGRIASIDDLPSKAKLTSLIKTAMKLNEADIRPMRAKPAPKDALDTPADLVDALARVGDATRNFDAFSPGARREYVEWIAEARRDETRASRIATAAEWIAEGRTRHWKYKR